MVWLENYMLQIKKLQLIYGYIIAPLKVDDQQSPLFVRDIFFLNVQILSVIAEWWSSVIYSNNVKDTVEKKICWFTALGMKRSNQWSYLVFFSFIFLCVAMICFMIFIIK